jgi:hypothetical protein
VVIDRPAADVTVNVDGALTANIVLTNENLTISGAAASLTVTGALVSSLDADIDVLAGARLTLAAGSSSTIENLLLAGSTTVLVNHGALALPSFDPTSISLGTFHNSASGVLHVESDAITVGNGVTLIEDGDLRGGLAADTIGSLSVNGGGSVTHSQGLLSGLSFRVTGTLTVNGSINVTGKGYLGAGEPGFAGLTGQSVPGLSGASGQAGGSHGGLGGSGGGTPNATYGSTTNPTDLGSGGGRPTTGAFLRGGNGGGLVDIDAGNIVVNGSIVADGAGPLNAGGGSGGSISLTLLPGGTVSGSGTIQANGGSAAVASTSGGGGGRVAIRDFATMTLSSNNVRAFPGDAISDGGAGTVYLESAAQADGHGDLIINSGNIASARVIELNASMADFNSVMVRNGRVLVASGADLALPIVLQSLGVLTNEGTLTLSHFDATNITAGTLHNTATGVLQVTTDAITVGSGVTFIEDGDIRGGLTPDTVGAFRVNNGGSVTHSQGLTAGLSFDVVGALTVDAGGEIDVSAKGFLGAGQPGNISFVGQTIAGQGGSSNNAGGSYGGLGGAGPGGVPNPTYGSVENPTDLGSGGGRTQIGAFVQAGNGGGRIDISAANFVVNGSILANGGNGFNSTGGSGGSIRLEVTPQGAGNVSGSGEIRANGGSAGGSGGGNSGGGGGRVAILEYDTLGLPLARITATGGGGAFAGAAGTVFLQEASPPAMTTSSGADASADAGGSGGTRVSTDQLEATGDVAITLWANALGLDRVAVDALDSVPFVIADLPDSVLAFVDGGTILIDVDAAGHGWFVAFAPPGNADSMDLLTVVSHEIGHLLGFDHEDALAVMRSTLDPGTRYAIDWNASASFPARPATPSQSNFVDFLAPLQQV